MDPVNKVAVDSPEREALRGPGLLESMSTVRHDLGFYTAVCCAARFFSSSIAPPGTQKDNALSAPSIPTLPLLYTALHEVIAQHPPLAVSVQDELSTSTRFVRLSSIDLERLIHVEPLPESDDEITRQRALSKVVERRLSTRFSDLGTLPLWRLVVFLPPNAGDVSPAEIDIALFIHHGIADGGSAVIFMRALLNALNAATAHQPFKSLGTIVSPPKSTAFLPSLEALHALPVSMFSLLGAIWRIWFPASCAGLWTGKPVSRPENVVQTRQAIHVFSAETVSSLLAAARAHNVTLTPLLETLVARALFASLPSTANRLVCSCPINMRAFMPESKGNMGVYVASDDHELVRTDVEAAADVWREAARVGSQLKRTLERIEEGKHVNVGMLRYVGNMRQNFEAKVGRPREHSFEVSNTGAVDDGSGLGAWRIGRLLFSQSGSVTGAAVTFSVSSVRGGPMSVAVSWVDGVVDEAVVDGSLERLVALVDIVCDGRL